MVKYPLLYLFIVFLCAKVNCRNMQVLYDFDQLPQTLMLNPGTIVDYDKHFGVPLLSNVYGMAGSSSRDVNYNNLVADAEDDGDVIRNLYNLGLESNEIFVFNQQIELINIGLRLKNPDYYLSFGMYQQTDGFSGYPEDLADLFFKGNDQDENGVPEFYDPFMADDVNSVFELVGVFHVGINKRVNEQLTIGGRFKLLSGSLGLQTGNNNGTYFLDLDPLSSRPYQHTYEDLNVRLNTAGFLDPFDLSNDLGQPSELFAGLFFINGSMGAAIDMGFTYKVDDELSFSGSILDIGMISFQHKLTTIEFEDDIIASEDYYDPSGGELDYWRTLYLTDQLPLLTEEKGFSYFRSPKINGSMKFKRYRKTKAKNYAFRNVSCDEDYTGDILESAYGMQVYTAFRPKTPVWAVTGFYSREFTPNLSAKATYTVDKFSFYNIGMGLSAHIKNFNIYATADNLVALTSIRNSNYQSVQFGMNFIF
ncbi:DUF5723 family protein [Lutimonas zeaxanthinifaciens]|uniref:DUF5723 family protein n=1 Tax=Lutimonas zeaxanthinifaciens TaxID=3060215 RepID=UPI00265CA5B5|nr:DUF5723 family protein [Lutimonas sp. YSD2104]WKK66776.1 DUF5723 family protein [Lutimonas sp. YSD2104]